MLRGSGSRRRGVIQGTASQTYTLDIASAGTSDASGIQLGGSLPARLAPSLNDGGTIFISPDGNDSTGTGTILNPYKSLHKAFSVVALTGGLIYCRGGSYDLTGTGVGGTPQQQFNRVGSITNPPQVKAYQSEVPVFNKEMVLIGTSSSTKGIRIGPGLTFAGGVNSAGWDALRVESVAGYVEIVGCTFTNAVKGNGILIGYPADPTQMQIWDCIFHHNGDTATPLYHGIYFGGGDGTCLIANSVFYDNARFAIQAGPRCNDLIITGCTAHSDGEGGDGTGGYTIWSQAPDNSNPNVRMYGCISTSPGASPYCYSFSGLANTDAPQIHDSIWNGSSVGGIEPQTGLITSNIVHADPLYVNATSRDLRLSATSPAIDLVAASHYPYLPATDILGNTRITADAGAYAKEA